MYTAYMLYTHVTVMDSTSTDCESTDLALAPRGVPADIYETLNSVWKVQFPKDPDPSRKIVGLMVPISSPQ